jgi:TIR domain-containing protein
MLASSAVRMSSIFVSYRRTDSPAHAGRIYDRLVDHFGEDRVFKDLDSLEPGAVFVGVLESTIDRCDACLAVIGQAWLPPERTRRRWAQDRPDWVRFEIARPSTATSA